MFARMLRVRPLRWAAQAAPLVVFGLLVWFSDWSRLTGLVSSSKAGLIALASIAALASTAAQAACWRTVLRAQGWHPPAVRCWVAHLAGLFLGRLTPNHLGEWAKVAYVLEGSAGRGLATVAAEKVLRAGLLVALGPLAALCLSGTGWADAVAQALRWPGRVGWGLLVLGVALAAASAVGLKSGWVRLPRQERLAEHWREFLHGLTALRRWEAAAALGWSAAGLAAFGLQALLVARALEIDLPALTVVANHLFALAVFTLVPVSAGGFGTEEVVLLSLFARLGVSGSAAMAYALVNIALLSLFLPAVGALVWLLGPLPFKAPGHAPSPAPALGASGPR